MIPNEFLSSISAILVQTIIKEIEDTGLTDPFEVADYYNVGIVITTMRSVPVLYYQDIFSNRPIIYIDSAKDRETQKILLWQGLGYHFIYLVINFKLNMTSPLSMYTINQFPIHFIDGLLDMSEIDEQTDIDIINKFIKVRTTESSEHYFSQIPLDNPFWTEI